MNQPSPIDFYYAFPSRGLTVRWLLEELGQPYREHVLDLRKGEGRRPEYLAINPMGKVPAIVHESVAITEAAAICCYLADAFPQAGLSIPVGDPRRGVYLKWLFFVPSCFEPAVMDRMYKREPIPREAIGYGDFDLVMKVISDAITPGPYLMGDQFTAADVVMGSNLHWAMLAKAIPEDGPLATYRDRLAARPAFQRMSQPPGTQG